MPAPLRNDFLNKWPRLPDDFLAPLSEQERALIRRHEDELIAGNLLQLQDLFRNCNVKPQFAKTYRVLRRDMRETLEKMRLASFKPHPAYSDLYLAALLRTTDRILSYKLIEMDYWFHRRWGEPIENWAGQEGDAFDRSGCVLLIAAGSAAIGTIASLILFFRP